MKKSKIIIIVLLAFALLFSACLDADENADKQNLSQEEVIEKMQGFWFMTGENGEIYEAAKNKGIAVDIDDEVMDTYSNFERDKKDTELMFVDDDAFEYEASNGTIEVKVFFESRDGYELMVWDRDGSEVYFERIDKELYDLYEGFQLGEQNFEYSVYLQDDLSDMQMAGYISDLVWDDLYYACEDGDTLDMNPHRITLDADFTGIYRTREGTEHITWEIYSGNLYIYYDDGSSYYYPFDYTYDSDSKYAYMYWYDLEEGYEGCAWIFYCLIEE